jgi:hypothetical protein
MWKNIVFVIVGACLGVALAIQWEDYQHTCGRQDVSFRLEGEFDNNRSIMKRWDPQEITSMESFAERATPLRNDVITYVILSGLFTYPEDQAMLDALNRLRSDILTINYSIEQITAASHGAKIPVLDIPLIRGHTLLASFFSILDRTSVEETMQKVEKILKNEEKTQWQIWRTLLPGY